MIRNGEHLICHMTGALKPIFQKDFPATTQGGALPGGIGWYRKTFILPYAISSRMHLIEFDGVYQKSEVWINGHYLGKWPNGYT